MKSIRVLSLVLSLSGVTVASAQAPGASGQPRARSERAVSPIVRALDADQDGEISLREIHASAASLRLLDTDADGTLSFAELHPGLPGDAVAPETPDARASRIDPVMLALDIDGNSELSPYEILAAKSRLLALDRNEDGKLARQETRPLPAASAE